MNKTMTIFMLSMMLMSIVPAASAKELPSYWERVNELPSMLGVDHYVDLYIYSEPHYLNRNIYWDETDNVHSSVSHGYYDTVYLQFEDWVDNSWDDVELNVWSDPDGKEFAVQMISSSTAARDPVHFKLGFPEETTIVVEKPKNQDRPAMEEVERQTGTNFDIILWDDVRDVDPYDFRIIKIVENEEEPEEDLADLVITDVAFVPPSVAAQEQVYFDVTVKNQGEATASPVTIRAYELLTTAKTSANEDRGSSWSGVELAGGESRTVRMGPYTFSAGTHQLMFKTDYLNAVEESDENNNDYYTTIEVEDNEEIELPDLVIEDISISPKNPTEGEHVSVKALVKNQGTQAAYDVDVYLYESLDANYDKNGATTKTSSSLTLNAGESASVDLGSYSFNEGVHQLMASVDPFNTVEESNEVNNDKYYSFSVGQEEFRHIKKEQLIYLQIGESVIVDDWAERIVTLKKVSEYTCTSIDCGRVASYTIESATGNSIVTIDQKAGESYYHSGAYLVTNSITSNGASMKITENLYDNGFSVWLSPSTVSVKKGEVAEYKLIIKNLQDIPQCGDGAGCAPAPKTIKLKLNTLPYANTLPKSVSVGPGQSKTVSFSIDTSKEISVPVDDYAIASSYYDKNSMRYTLRVTATDAENDISHIAYGYLLVKDSDEITDYLSASMYPSSKTVEAGAQATYTIKLQDLRVKPACASNHCAGTSIRYQLDLSGMPFASTLPSSVSLSEGEHKELSFVIYTTEDGGYSEDGEYPFSITLSANYGNENIKEKVSANLKVKDSINPPPFPEDSVEIPLKRGWNLVSIPGKLERFLPSDCTNYKKLLGFVMVDGEYMTLQEAQNELGDEFSDYISTQAVWIYAYENCKLAVEISAPITPIDIDAGWNLIPVRNDMVGQSWSSALSGCGLESVYEYNAASQKWKKVSSASKIHSSDIGTGFAIKASHSCTIGELVPPEMPHY